MDFKPLEPCKTLPSFSDSVAISKASISDLDIFKEYIALCNLTILFDEPGYIILAGSHQDIRDFIEYW